MWSYFWEVPIQPTAHSAGGKEQSLTENTLDESVGSQKLEGVDLKQHCVEQQLSRCRPLGRVFLDAQSQKILQRNRTDQHSSNNKQTTEKGKSMGIFYTLNPLDFAVQQI